MSMESLIPAERIKNPFISSEAKKNKRKIGFCRENDK
jgi:hypothetical protein